MFKNPLQALLALFFTLVLAPMTVAAADAPVARSVSADEARRALSVLQDDDRRAEAVRTLSVIADAAPASDEPAAGAEAPAAESAAEAPATPLEADGLVARTLNQVGNWASSLGDQVGQIMQAARDLPVWGRASFTSEEGRGLLIRMLLSLVTVFAVGLGLEWGLRRLLARPYRALNQHAEEAEARSTQQNKRRRQALEVAQAEERNRALAAQQGAAAETTVTGGARSAPEGMALVQTYKDGVEQIEAVPVGSANSASGGTAAIDTGTDDVPPALSVAEATESARAPSPDAHRNALRYLPFTLGALLLDLLPLVLFFCAAGLMMHWFAAEDERIHIATRGFVDAYVTTRITMAVVGLLISPVGHGLRVLKERGISAILQTWVRGFVVLATFGIAIANTVEVFGAGLAGRMAVIKLVSLLVHSLVVILIFRVWRPVGAAIAAPAQASGPFATLRNWLAQVWPFFAAAFVMGVWVIWALGIEDGFPKLLYFIGISGGIIVVARLAAILALGALGRAFDDDSENGDPAIPGARRRAERYYPLFRRLITVVITACTIVALCQAWGLHALAWFAPGTIGRNLVSALLTILIAAAVAVFIWDAANAAIERRLARWSELGDLMRAARLRTLLPMLRSCLFIAIALIVGLTALNQLGINTTPLVAGASIIGVAVGFGSQKLVQDFITGIFLLMENAMQVGDWVTVAGVSGTVEYLSIRTVRVRAGDGSLHIVPFSSVSTVNNTNRGIGNAAVGISVSYDTDIEEVFAELKKIGAELRSDPAFKGQILADIEVWGVDSVDGAMVKISGQMRCTDSGRWGVQREINRRILKRFREMGIEIANSRASVLVPQVPTEHPAPTK